MSRPRLSNEALRWLEIVLAERFGHLWSLRDVPHGLELRMVGSERCISFDATQECFLEYHSNQPFTRWDAAAEGWSSVLGDPLPAPGVASLPRPLIERNGNGYVVHYDVLGLVYWMLARVEEIGRTDLDNHDRFPATSSHAYKHGYLELPVVDEWLDVLGQVLERQWPSVALNSHEFRVEVSHDVDRPSRYLCRPLGSAMRSAFGDVVLRGDLLSPLRALWVRGSSPDALHPADPYNTFDWLMDVSEQHNLQSTFYFKTGRSNPQFDAIYEIGHPAIRKLLRCIHKRGHHIGLHPSYECYRDAEQIRREAEALWRVCEQEGIRQDEWGARMHYLRWLCPKTPYALEAAGLTHDSTPGYADHIGFRCGTCFSYPLFDPQGDRTLGIRIRPLTVMDCSIYSPEYMNLSSAQEAVDDVATVANNARLVRGVFSLLWHNSELSPKRNRSLYLDALGTAIRLCTR